MRHILVILLGGIIMLASCTELEQEPYDELTQEQFYKTERQVISSIGPAYAEIPYDFAAHWGVWGAQEIPTDQIMIPTRGKHWYDGGAHLRPHWHNWNLTEAKFNTSWSWVYGGVSTCNRIKYQIEQLENPSETAQKMVNELNALRAFYYFWGLDMFGNIPIVKKHDVPENYAPDNSSREEVFNFLVSDLEEAIPNMSGEVTSRTYGRLNKWGAFTLLAKLYLNAPVYTGNATGINGTTMWDKTIAACDSVINSGKYSLEEDYFANFATDNENSSENIFVAPLDPKYSNWGGYSLAYASLHYQNNKSFEGFMGGPWNGVCAVPSFIDSYSENDIREDMWLSGYQTNTEGDTLEATVRLAGEPLEFINEVHNIENAWENEGLRINKYDYTNYENGNTEGDLVLFRYADVLLMKAEALMRKNGGEPTGEALQLVNKVHTRAGMEPLDMNELTLDTLLAERGHEFATEMWRRNDLIRFGEFTKPFYEDSDVENIQKKVVNQDYVRLFPIPSQQRNANPNLDQNPGY
ncbi:MAG: RagB/SusD family nutrient uptake outer membrane protein [Bacteroidales bacterium]|nr:RagB/SusD family nutrient uptake outer membrane protein [Bacteroidales bacterium]